MFGSITIDASVLVKAFVSEEYSQQAEAVFDSNLTPLAPAHALAEAGHVLYRKRRSGAITNEQLGVAVLGFRRSFVAVPLEPIFDHAVRIALNLDHSVYDTLYIATALRHECQFVTADRKLVSKVRGTRFETAVVHLANYRLP